MMIKKLYRTNLSSKEYLNSINMKYYSIKEIRKKST